LEDDVKIGWIESVEGNGRRGLGRVRLRSIRSEEANERIFFLCISGDGGEISTETSSV